MVKKSIIKKIMLFAVMIITVFLCVFPCSATPAIQSNPKNGTIVDYSANVPCDMFILAKDGSGYALDMSYLNDTSKFPNGLFNAGALNGSAFKEMGCFVLDGENSRSEVEIAETYLKYVNVGRGSYQGFCYDYDISWFYRYSDESAVTDGGKGLGLIFKGGGFVINSQYVDLLTPSYAFNNANVFVQYKVTFRDNLGQLYSYDSGRYWYGPISSDTYVPILDVGNIYGFFTNNVNPQNGIISQIYVESYETFITFGEDATIGNAEGVYRMPYVTYYGFDNDNTIYWRSIAENSSGSNTPIDNVDFATWIVTAIQSFFEFDIGYGITLGGVLSVCLCLGLVISFLKFFAGG